MASLQQRTDAWHAARRGKLTASNLGALLGQVSYTSRQQAFRRALGTDPFVGNVATQWGTDNELNGITDYTCKTGNIVTSTGLHVHNKYPWLAGSPDGFVADDGIVEIKCPYFQKRDGSSRIHQSVPVHYWLQVNALLEITERDWCDYVCWTPEGMAIYRVSRDATTFDYLCQYYAAIYAAIRAFADKPPPMSKAQILEVTDRVKLAMKRGVDLTFWKTETRFAPPVLYVTDESDTESSAEHTMKRQRVSYSDSCDTPSE